MSAHDDVLRVLLAATAEASAVVLRVYSETDFGVELKGPNDPVTRADREANALLVDRLSRELPGVPIVAEESDPGTFAGFGEAPAALFVDPVDGTREFVAKNDEFAVMIGYAEAGAPTVAVVACPAMGVTYGGIVGTGAFVIRGKDGAREPIAVSTTATLAEASCAVSRYHRTPVVDGKLRALGAKALVPTGSAGVKGVRVASAALDVYAHPSAGGVKLWDACAPDAIVRAAGGVFTDATGRAFDYRGPLVQGSGLLGANAVLHAEAVKRFASWKSDT